MVRYDVFVHPGFPAEERKVRGSRVFQEYCDRLSALAASAEYALHVVDPKVGHHDAFLEKFIPADRRVRSYVLNIPFYPASYGTVSTEDWEKYVGLLRDIRKQRDPVLVHGSYHGLCALDFAVQLYELLHNGKQYLPDSLSCLLEDSPFPFCKEETESVVTHALQAHYLNSNIRFGTVFADITFNDMQAVRKSIARQMTDKDTKVYSL